MMSNTGLCQHEPWTAGEWRTAIGATGQGFGIILPGVL